ncbi:MAG: class II aldolase/adducin family protein [Desulfosarcinaceae bacterium]|nr:class II aldolase/adducin family protein [Desulfosarcinaceae bacterium]
MAAAALAMEIVAVGRKMAAAGLTTGSGGNISALDDGGRVTITPSGIAYADLTPEQLVVTDRRGERLADGLTPSSELGFHLALYDHRPDIRAVVHTHSVYATTFACLREEIPAVHYLVGYCGHKVRVAPYATFGTPALAAGIIATIGEDQAVLLANHGLVAVGPSLTRAFAVAEEIELVARLYYQTRAIGRPHILSEAEMNAVLEKFKGYGQRPPAAPP